MDWELFEIVKEVRGPNRLLAFAPNDISYHAVRFIPPAGASSERTVVRGFVARKGYRDTTLVPESASPQYAGAARPVPSLRHEAP
jgi:hypothetical protein